MLRMAEAGGAGIVQSLPLSILREIEHNGEGETKLMRAAMRLPEGSPGIQPPYPEPFPERGDWPRHELESALACHVGHEVC